MTHHFQQREPVLENIQVPNEAALGGRVSPNSDCEEPPVYSESNETEEAISLIIQMPREVLAKLHLVT